MSNTRKPRRASTPTCSCSHNSGSPGLCGRPARFRVTLVCSVQDCNCAAASYLLCGTCLDRLLELAENDPLAAEMRIAAL